MDHKSEIGLNEKEVLNVNLDNMDDVIRFIENTVNKSTIRDFRCFINNHQDVTKWILCSDYCFDDKEKPNDVISFVLFPYIMELSQFQEKIESFQATDIKKSKHISDAFRKFTHEGYFFSINFAFDKEDNYFEKWRNKDVQKSVVDQCIKLMDVWKESTPHCSSQYDEFQSDLMRLKEDMRANNFNVKMMHRMLLILFLASYIRYLLLREVDEVEIFSWISDRDNITSMNKGVYADLYAIISHCICANRLTEEKYRSVRDYVPANSEEQILGDSLNRVPDIICGIISDYNIKENKVSKEKYLEGIEGILADNPNIVQIIVYKEGMARGLHTKNVT